MTKKNNFYRPSITDSNCLHTLETLESLLVKPNSGLTVIFEDRVFDLGAFRDEAFFVSRKDFDRDGAETNTPPEIKTLLEMKDWEYFIWIPRWVVNSPEQILFFRYAHELQHYCQKHNDINLKNIVRFIHERTKAGYQPTISMECKSTEFDADRQAYESFLSVYGKDKWLLFVAASGVSERRHLKLLEVMYEKWISYKVTENHH